MDMRTTHGRGRLAYLASLSLLAFAAGACSDSTGSGTAQVSLALTDQPGDVDSVWVQIAEIYLQGGGNGRVTLLDEVTAEGLGLIELTQLTGETLDLVSGVEVPAGNYGQLRFVLDGAVLETEDGGVFAYNAVHPHGAPVTGELKCPSCDQTGIKVLLPGNTAELEAGAHLIVLDFDVSQSFGHEAGQSESWVMHPVIRGAELGFTGSITGTVDVDPLVTIPECPTGESRDVTSFVPTAVAQTLTDDLDDPVVVMAPVAADGSFSFPFLVPDAYGMTYAPQIVFGAAEADTLTFEADVEPGLIDVTTGASLVVEYTITSAVCNTNP